MARRNRLLAELPALQRDPPPGVRATLEGDSMTRLVIQMQGPDSSPYAGGTFEVSVTVPERYPFDPPVVQFKTPVLHPNIDGQGRVCLDILNMPPKGAWKPSLNIITVLISIRLLLQEPNPDDPLVPELAQEFVRDRQAFDARARQHTLRYACRACPDAVETCQGGRACGASTAGNTNPQTDTPSLLGCTNHGTRQDADGSDGGAACGTSEQASTHRAAAAAANVDTECVDLRPGCRPAVVPPVGSSGTAATPGHAPPPAVGSLHEPMAAALASQQAGAGCGTGHGPALPVLAAQPSVAPQAPSKVSRLALRRASTNCAAGQVVGAVSDSEASDPDCKRAKH